MDVRPSLDAESFARLASEMFALEGLQPTVENVVRLAVETVDGCHYAGVTERVGRRDVTTLASTSDVVEKADALQYELDEGPCLDAIRREDTYVSNDLGSDRRWPNWGPKTAELGLHGVLTVRLAWARGTVGALNLYSRDREAFDGHDVDVAHVFARHATIALSTVEELEGLRSAMQSRHSIGLAQGILMERYGLSADGAFDVLRRYSRESNVKLRDVAAGVVESFDRSRAERSADT